MRRDSRQALEELDAIDRYTRQLRRWIEVTPAWAAEEDYDALHRAVQDASVILGGCYQQWHFAGRETSSPASSPVDSGGNDEGGRVPDRSPSGPAQSPASELHECPYCDGRGWNTIAVHDPTDPDGEPLPEQEQCATCGGSGEVSRPAKRPSE